MNEAAAITTERTTQGQAPVRRSAQQAFLQTLGKRMDGVEAPRTPQQQAHEAAQDMVSQTFVQPMLKLFRESNHAAPPFAPTPAEKQFRSLMDVQLAQQIVNAKQFPIVARIEQSLLERGGKHPVVRDAMRELHEGAERTRQQIAATGAESSSFGGVPAGAPVLPIAPQTRTRTP